MHVLHIVFYLGNVRLCKFDWHHILNRVLRFKTVFFLIAVVFPLIVTIFLLLLVIFFGVTTVLLTIVLYVIFVDIIVHMLEPCFGLLLLSLSSMVMRLFTLIIFKVLVITCEIFRAYYTVLSMARTLHI